MTVDPPPSFVLFIGDEDESSGRNWCPDCERVTCSIERIADENKVNLLVVTVGARDEWKSPDHVFRKDKRLQLAGIPTLLAWNGEWERPRIDKPLEQVTSVEDVENLVIPFLEKHRPSKEDERANFPWSWNKANDTNTASAVAAN